jgi:hypothetical protein
LRNLHGDKGYDANAIGRQVEERGAMLNIPPKANRKWKTCFSRSYIASHRAHVLPRAVQFSDL